MQWHSLILEFKIEAYTQRVYSSDILRAIIIVGSRYLTLYLILKAIRTIHTCFLDVDVIREGCNAHIVGQVDDDVLLFTWDCKDDREKVTCSGILYYVDVHIFEEVHIFEKHLSVN